MSPSYILTFFIHMNIPPMYNCFKLCSKNCFAKTHTHTHTSMPMPLALHTPHTLSTLTQNPLLLTQLLYTNSNSKFVPDQSWLNPNQTDPNYAIKAHSRGFQQLLFLIKLFLYQWLLKAFIIHQTFSCFTMTTSYIIYTLIYIISFLHVTPNWRSPFNRLRNEPVHPFSSPVDIS